MTVLLVIQLTALAVLFACSAFFSSAETSMFSIDALRLHRIRQRRSRAADRIERILASPTALLSTILIGNTLVNVAASELGYVIAGRFLGDHAETVAIPAMILLLLLLGEVTPKRVAVRMPERIAPLYAPLLLALIRLAGPLRWVLDGMTRMFRKSIEFKRRPLSEEEFLTALRAGEEDGVIDREERTMVNGILRLQSLQARDVMTPRVDLVGIDLNAEPSAHLATARGCRFRYLPVYRGSLDNVEGLLDVEKFLLHHPDRAVDATGPAHFVPETAPLRSLLATFQAEKRRVAVVVDEYGGTAGLVSRADILEEIVAYVDDETERRGGTGIEPAGRNCWLVDGNVSLGDVNRELSVALEAEGADRVAGWVIARAGHIPKPGDVLEAGSCRVTVKHVKKNRVRLVMVCRCEDAPAGEAGRGHG